MKRIFKILGIIFLIIILLIGLGIFFLYQNNKWIINAEDMSGISFGSSIFNEKLKGCTPSFSYSGSYFNEPWEIRGIKKDKCIIYYYELTDIDYEKGGYTEKIHKCRLPYPIYSVSDGINWSVLLKDSNYCFW